MTFTICISVQHVQCIVSKSKNAEKATGKAGNIKKQDNIAMQSVEREYGKCWHPYHHYCINSGIMENALIIIFYLQVTARIT